MALKLVSLEDAARTLGVSVEELTRLREEREISGYRDGASWKFKEQDLERLRDKLADRAASPTAGEDDLLPVNTGGDDLDDIVLLSDLELGQSDTGTSSTIIGKPGAMRPEESDVKLVTADAEPVSAGGSDVRLVDEMTISPDADTDLRLGSNEEFSIEISPSSSSSDLKLSGDSAPRIPTPGGSDIALAEESALEDVDLVLGSSGGSDLDDDELVLSSGSDITMGAADSGISLASPSDSGLSLEDPLELSAPTDESFELGGIEAVGEATDGSSDDNFLLTPFEEAGGEESSQDSGSQVIALDADSGLGGDSLFEEVPGADSGGMLVEDYDTAGMAGGLPGAGLAPAGMMQVMPREQQYSAWQIAGLVTCSLFLALSGMMMYDLMRHMWSWDSPYAVNSKIMDTILNLFGGG
jgi:excisionase family DNA binding protein